MNRAGWFALVNQGQQDRRGRLVPRLQCQVPRGLKDHKGPLVLLLPCQVRKDQKDHKGLLVPHLPCQVPRGLKDHKGPLLTFRFSITDGLLYIEGHCLLKLLQLL
jgi:hypothetical protein